MKSLNKAHRIYLIYLVLVFKEFLYRCIKPPYAILAAVPLILYLFAAAQISCQDTSRCWEIIISLMQDVLIIWFFYYLLDYKPKKRENERIKKRLRNAFKDFKMNVLFIFISAGNIKGYTDISKLTHMHQFRKLFEHNNFAQWDAVYNGLDQNEQLVEEIIKELNELRTEISRAIENGEIQDENVYDFLENSSKAIGQFKRIKPGTDDLKIFLRFIWSIFAGDSWLHGLLIKDPIEDNIDKF